MSKSRRVSDTLDFWDFPASWRSYVAIMRVDHWFKNVFMLVGVFLAVFHNPHVLRLDNFPVLILGIMATCILASSNYVLNEIQDAEFDRFHPKKKFHPIPSGSVQIHIAYAEWVILAILGLVLAAFVNRWFLYTGAALFFMGLVYNVRPFRLKDLPYLDVLSESVNNPIRLLLGWFIMIPDKLPSLSLLLAFWFLGAFFMATKRFAEYRTINDPKLAENYRKSFGHYSEPRLLSSMVFYLSLFALCYGVFIMKYHFELILSAPFILGFTSYYFHIGFKEDSTVQAPEHLYKEKWLVFGGMVCVVTVFLLLFTDIPQLYEWFNVLSNQVSPLWKF